MVQDFACFNSECPNVDVAVPVAFQQIAENAYQTPNPTCVCHWSMGAVSAIYDAPAA